MSAQFEISNAQIHDFDEICAIYGYCVENETASWEYFAPDKSELIRRFEAITGANYPYLVAKKEGQIVGYAYAGLFRGREGWRFVCENSVYIHRDFRGHGIGKSLMVKLIAECKAQGLKNMIAVIGDSENHASVALHKSLGFKEIGIFEGVGEKFSQILDSVFMQLKL